MSFEKTFSVSHLFHGSYCSHLLLLHMYHMCSFSLLSCSQRRGPDYPLVALSSSEHTEQGSAVTRGKAVPSFTHSSFFERLLFAGHVDRYWEYGDEL